LTEYIVSDRNIILTDVLPIFRTTLASFDGTVFTLLFDGNIHSLFYRADLLDQKEFDVPNTIEELIEQVEEFNGQDLNEDGEPDFGLCIAFGEITSRDAQFANNVLATFLQTQSTNQGFLFDPDTFEPNINTDSARRGLTLFKELFDVGVNEAFRNGTFNIVDVRGMFLSGRCAFTLDWGGIPRIAFYDKDTLAGSVEITRTENGTNFPYVKELFHTAPWPGTEYVMDPDSRKSVKCTRNICPHSIKVDNRLINIAPYNAFGGFGGMISSLVTQEEKDEAYAMMSFWNAPAISNLDVADPISFFEPYRYSQFLPFLWLNLGMSDAQVEAYTIEMRANLENENIALELRVPGSNDYLVSFGENIFKYVNDEIDLDEVIDDTLSKWEKITDNFGGHKKQRDINRKLLSLEPITKNDDSDSDDTLLVIAVPTILGSIFLFLFVLFVVVALVVFFFKYTFHVILLPRNAEDTTA